MKTSNQASQSLRQSEVGLVWKALLGTAATPAAGTIKVPLLSSLRVRASAACDITIDGELSVSLLSGDTVILCVGSGDNSSSDKKTVSVVFSGTVVCSVAKDNIHAH
jgi:hypothetical protein